MEHPLVAGAATMTASPRAAEEVPARRFAGGPTGTLAAVGGGGLPRPTAGTPGGGLDNGLVGGVLSSMPPRPVRSGGRSRKGERAHRQLACPTPRRAVPTSSLVGGLSASSSPFEGAWADQSPPSRPSTAPVLHALPYHTGRLGLGMDAPSAPSASQSSAALPVGMPPTGRAPRRSSNPMCRDVFFARGLHHPDAYKSYRGAGGGMRVPVDGAGGRVDMGPSASSPCLDL